MARILGNIKTDIALVLAPTNTGRLTLTRTFGNDYTGGTTIGGGKLIAAGNPAGSSTGTGPVAVNNGGTLGGNGGAAPPVPEQSRWLRAATSRPGLATGTTIGTLTALGAVSLGSGSRLDIDLGAPAPGGGTSDRLDLPNGTALTVPGTAASIGVNLSDPAGGAAGNGTYRLMTFPAGQYTGSSNASQFFTSSLPSPNSLNGATITYQLADDSNVNQDGNPSAATRVNMIVSGGPNALVWTGAVDGTWNVGTPASPFNFNNLNTASGSAFASNDNVTFDDTGANTTPITVAAGGVQPNIVTINNSTATYTFSGGDIKGSSVGGGGGLFLGGTGPVTIDSNYTAAGPIMSNKSGDRHRDVQRRHYGGHVRDGQRRRGHARRRQHLYRRQHGQWRLAYGERRLGHIRRRRRDGERGQRGDFRWRCQCDSRFGDVDAIGRRHGCHRRMLDSSTWLPALMNKLLRWCWVTPRKSPARTVRRAAVRQTSSTSTFPGPESSRWPRPACLATTTATASSTRRTTWSGATAARCRTKLIIPARSTRPITPHGEPASATPGPAAGSATARRCPSQQLCCSVY